MAESDFSRFMREKRQQKQITLSELAERSGISTGYCSDIEYGRRKPPDREILTRLINALNLAGEDKVMLNDLAGKARSEAPPDLPDYINENEKVRVALRMAKDGGDTRVWDKFISLMKIEKEDE